MKKFFLLGSLLLLLSSCIDLDKINFQGIDRMSVESISTRSVDLSLEVSVENGAPRMMIRQCNLELSTGGLSSTSFAEVRLENPVLLRKGINENLPVNLNVRIKGGIFGLNAVKNLIKEKKREIFVTGTIIVRKSLIVKRIRLKNYPLEDIAKTLSL